MFQVMDDGSVMINFDWSQIQSQLSWWHIIFANITYGLFTHWVSLYGVRKHNALMKERHAILTSRATTRNDRVVADKVLENHTVSDVLLGCLLFFRTTFSIPYRLVTFGIGLILSVCWGTVHLFATIAKMGRVPLSWHYPKVCLAEGWKWYCSPEEIVGSIPEPKDA